MSAYQVDTDIIDLIVTASIGGWGDSQRPGMSVFVPSAEIIVIHTQEIRDRMEPLTADSPAAMIRLSREDYTILGRELIAANIASLAARYSDCKAGQRGGLVGYLPEDYSFKAVQQDKFADIVHVLGAFACYRYQTCEACDEDRSFWGRFCNVAEHRLIATLPGVENGWSWSRGWQSVERAKLRAEINRNGLTLIKS